MPTTEVAYLVHDTVAYLVNGFRLNEQSVDNPIMEQEQDVRNVNTDNEKEATVVKNEINRKEKNITISEIKLPVKLRIKGRPKGRNQTVIGLLKKLKSGKKQGPKPFSKSNKDKEKVILEWIVGPDLASKAIDGLILEATDILSQSLLDSCLDSYVDMALVHRYFSVDEWKQVNSLMKNKRKKADYTCDLCFNTLDLILLILYVIHV